MALTNVVALVGGVGGAKLAHGLAQILPPERLTIIVNTGDDFVHRGLHISPDMDTVMYTLAGVVDKGNGWGIAGDTTGMLEMLRRYGETPWFRLGDADLATHLQRTEALANGERLTTITRRLSENLGVIHPILPMSDQPVRTMIDTVEYGEIPFQEYFVRHRWQPTLKGVRFAGAESASMTTECRAAITRADAILIAPSNPWLSIDPIYAVPGMGEALTERAIPRVAISPIVQGQALKGPAAKLMGELGYPVSAAAVGEYYGKRIDGFVYDQLDAPLRLSVEHSIALNTVMKDEADRAVLAGAVMRWIEKEWTR